MPETKKPETKKEPDYPIWPGPEDAEHGVTYKLAKSGNLIQHGDVPE